MKRYEFPCLALKPRWAREIYAGEKRWEFRLRPLPLQVPMAVYESAPVKQITGAVVFDAIVAAPLDGIFTMISSLRASGDVRFLSSSGGSVTYKELADYAGKRTIFAHHVRARGTLFGLAGVGIGPVPKPPQSWGTVVVPLPDKDAKLLEALDVAVMEKG